MTPHGNTKREELRSRTGVEELAEITPVENTSRNSTRKPYGRNLYQCGSQASGSTRSMQRRAVERRDRQQVEEAEEQVHHREREQDLHAERQIWSVNAGRDASSGRTAPAPRAPTPTISRKFVTGPARLTKSMSRRGLRIRFGFTGTGFAHASTGMPDERAHRRQHDRAERVDVRDRVQREPARLLGGVVAEPERDDAVADLVQDDRDDEAAEEDDRLLRRGARERRVVLSGAATRSRCRGAPPASPRAAPRGCAGGRTRTRRRCRRRTWRARPRCR